MIRLKNLSYYYGKQQASHGRQPVAALNNISATVGPGIFLLLGENGAGKTTLLRNIAGILLPSVGTCEVNGKSTALRLPSELDATYYLGCDSTTMFRTVGEMARRHAPFYPRFSAERLSDNLKTFGIKPDDKIKDMSLGTRHKAMLAYSLSLNVGNLLLDEPANGLDIESKERLVRMIARCVEEESTVIVSTHTISDLSTLYDGLMVMQGGSLLLSSTSDDILRTFSFVKTSRPIPEALYSEMEVAKYHSILPADEAESMGMQSEDVDCKLLYHALHSPVATDILDRLNGAPGALQSFNSNPQSK